MKTVVTLPGVLSAYAGLQEPDKAGRALLCAEEFSHLCAV